MGTPVNTAALTIGLCLSLSTTYGSFLLQWFSTSGPGNTVFKNETEPPLEFQLWRDAQVCDIGVMKAHIKFLGFV
jgi:hypothetical protein